MKQRNVSSSLCCVVLSAFAWASEGGRGPAGELLRRAASNVERYRKGPIVLQVRGPDGRALPKATVQVSLTRHEFLFGCIIFDLVRWENLPEAELYKRRFRDLFNFAVFPFYWASYERRRGQTEEARLKRVARWCRQQGMTLKGHPLLWTNRAGVPSWVRGLPPERSEALVLARVEREVRRFAGLIDMWDVVNEAVHCRTWKHVGVRDYIREPIGELADMVEKAFRRAHEANPASHLILNEYSVIPREDIRERFYRLVSELKRRRVPLSGLGLQAHEPRQAWFAPQQVWEALNRMASLGYALHITEFIPQSSGKPITGSYRKGVWTEHAQAEYAEQFYRVCFGHPAVRSINWWGLSDRHIWLPGGGLLRKNYDPKPVYNCLERLIHQEWTTHVSGETSRTGTFRFRGFYGSYAVRIKTAEGKERLFHAAARRGMENVWRFSLR